MRAWTPETKQKFIDDLVSECIAAQRCGKRAVVLSGEFHYMEIVPEINAKTLASEITVHYGVFAKAGDYEIDIDERARKAGLSA